MRVKCKFFVEIVLKINLHLHECKRLRNFVSLSIPETNKGALDNKRNKAFRHNNESACSEVLEEMLFQS